MAQGIDATKTPGRPSHEAIEEDGGEATKLGESKQEKLDQVGMESAKRAQNRIHSDEDKNPGGDIFTK